MSRPVDPARAALSVWRRLEHGFDAVFGTRANPLRQLGALGLCCLWLLVASGVYLYVFFDTSVAGAYRSIVDMTRDQPWAGGVIRSLHRYGADALVLLLGAHLAREWVYRHDRGARRHAWLTGLPTIVLIFASAVGGFWLHWDQLAQYSAVATAEWIDVLPFLSTPLARNFLTDGAVTDRLFSLMVFVHLGVPLLLLFALWFHVQRLTRAAVWPSPAASAGFLVCLLALSVIVPVSSLDPASLASVPASLRLDWILLFVHPLAESVSPYAAWALVAGVLGVLSVLPFMPGPARLPVAVVDVNNCNGCRRCFVDCPFSAVTMVPHPKGKRGREMAKVDAELCASCGICVGACPSSTPFRSVSALVTGIDLPWSPISDLRRDMRRRLASPTVERPVVVFGCDHGASVSALDDPGVVVFSLKCAGMLPPSFVEYALRDGAAGVIVGGCRAGGCEFRLGQQWASERLAASREPYLRQSVPRERLETAWADAGEVDVLRGAVARLRERLSRLPADPTTETSSHHA